MNKEKFPNINKTQEEGESVAKKLNQELPGHSVRYGGVQEGFGSAPKTYLFTPQEGLAEGATFNVKSLKLEDVKAGLQRMIDLRKPYK